MTQELNLNQDSKTDAPQGGQTSQQQGHNPVADEKIAIEVEKLNLFYGEKQALFDIDLQIPEKKVTAFIGPSGCGKSTLLRCFNRMNDLVDIARTEVRFVLIMKTFMAKVLMLPSYAVRLEWYSRNRILSRNRFMKM